MNLYKKDCYNIDGWTLKDLADINYISVEYFIDYTRKHKEEIEKEHFINIEIYNRYVQITIDNNRFQ